MEFLIEPLRYDFILRGLAGGLLTAVSCSALSGLVVWRRMSFMGDALAHSMLPGVVVAYVLGISLFWGALAAAAVAVVGIAAISGRGGLTEDTAIGVVFAGFFALGLLMLSRVVAFSDLRHILFGNLLGVSRSDLVMMGAAATIAAVGIGIAFKEIVTASFDPAHAAAIGLSPQRVRYLVLVLLAITAVAAIQTVGVVLVLALLVTPGAAASLVSRKLTAIIALSLVFAVAATFLGFYASYYADVPSGPAIVLALTAEFILCALMSRFRFRSFMGGSQP